MNKIDLNKYSDFVFSVTSNESKDFEFFVNKLNDLHHNSDINVPLLITGYTGIESEAGEFTEVIKKIVFQGKPVNEENLFHLKLLKIGDLAKITYIMLDHFLIIMK